MPISNDAITVPKELVTGVVNVNQVRTIDRRRLGDPIGALSPRRIREVLHGLSLVFGTEEALEPDI